MSGKVGCTHLHTPSHLSPFFGLLQSGLYLRIQHKHRIHITMASGYQNIDQQQAAPVYTPAANTQSYADQEALYSGPTSYGSPSTSETTPERPSWVSVGGVRPTCALHGAFSFFRAGSWLFPPSLCGLLLPSPLFRFSHIRVVILRA